MTARPADLLAFLSDQAASLTPEERADIANFAEQLDPDVSLDKLTARLSRFLLDHPDLDRRLAEHPAERIAGQPIKLTPEVFKTNLRNLVLQSQQSPAKDGGSTPKR